MKVVAVFCGSNFGASDAYRAAAESLGREIAARGMTLVYGGTHLGLMGAVADAALAAGGEVVGVINRSLHGRGHLHEKLTQHEIVVDMRARKARMCELADAFVALPGGLGTLEELFEVATLNQLGEHGKAFGTLNVLGFYDPLRALLDRAVTEGFMKREHRDMMVVESTVPALLDALESWQAPTVTKWIAPPDA